MPYTVPKRCPTDIPGVLSEQPFVFGTNPNYFSTGLDANIFYFDPNGIQSQDSNPANRLTPVMFRGINVLVTDFSLPATDRTITYVAPNGQLSYLIANRNGEHPVAGIAIIDVGAAFDLPSLQVLV